MERGNLSTLQGVHFPPLKSKRNIGSGRRERIGKRRRCTKKKEGARVVAKTSRHMSCAGALCNAFSSLRSSPPPQLRALHLPRHTNHRTTINIPLRDTLPIDPSVLTTDSSVNKFTAIFHARNFTPINYHTEILQPRSKFPIDRAPREIVVQKSYLQLYSEVRRPLLFVRRRKNDSPQNSRNHSPRTHARVQSYTFCLFTNMSARAEHQRLALFQELFSFLGSRAPVPLSPASPAFSCHNSSSIAPFCSAKLSARLTGLL